MRATSRFLAPIFGVGLVMWACSSEDGQKAADDGHDHEHDDAGAGAAGTGGGANRGGAGGEGGGTATGDAGVQELSLKLRGAVGEEDFSCSARYAGLGTSGTTLEPLDFRFYVKAVALIDAEGQEVPAALVPDGKWQTQDVALIDFEDGSGSCANGNADTNDTLRVEVPKGEYSGLAFTVGVPSALNHENPAQAASPLNLTTLHWNWNAGYKFMRVDFRVPPMSMMDDAGAPDAAETDGGSGSPSETGGHGAAPPAVNFHLGSTMCTGDAAGGEGVVCARANRPRVVLEGFDPTSGVVVVDAAELLAGIDAATDQGGAPGCMSGGMDPECGPMFAALGLHLETGEPSPGGSVFRMEGL
jgi:uncharacterized repeat protein (TIGR04052 family)